MLTGKSQQGYEPGAPMPWVVRGLAELPAGAKVLDFACGSGRHSCLAATLGHQVLAVDRNPDALAALTDRGHPAGAVMTLCADLEAAPWPFARQRFEAVIVTNYLFRPRLDALAGLLVAGGRLIYATFADGNARFGRPANPEFLLREGELLAMAARTDLVVVAYEAGITRDEPTAQVQRLVAWRRDDGSERPLV